MQNYDYSRQQNESKFQHLVRVSVDKLNKLHNKEWIDIKEEFDFNHSAESLRKYASGWKILFENGGIEQLEDSNDEPLIKYKETTEILNDGSQKSDKLIKMSVEQSKDADYLLEVHGFDKNEWILVSARNNLWNTKNQTQGIQTLYSSRITVKPNKNSFDMIEFIEELKKEVKPINVDYSKESDGGLLEIPLFDAHFGIADLEYYTPTLNKISRKIESKKWDKILFVIGQDVLHTNDLKGNTANGTYIGKINFKKAVKDAKEFYITLINLAIKNSTSVDVVYSAGNHDETTGYMFVQILETIFPQINFDSDYKERKCFTWKDITLLFTHGDKSPMNRTIKAFLSEYGKEIALSKIVEVHSGHFHSEKSHDDFGIVFRTLSTRAKTDDWHDVKAFVGSKKRFQIFEYSEDELDAITYV